MKNKSGITKIIEGYNKNPVLKGLSQILPYGIGSGVDAVLATTLQNIHSKRKKEFFDELSSGDIELTSDLLESEDFLHCYFATAKYALNSRRKEKIMMFARLLKSATLDNSFSCTDEYEEYLSILDELSFRELSILYKLHQFESNYPQLDGETDIDRANRFWDLFLKDLIEQLGISEKEIDSLLIRLTRTGCYEKCVAFMGTTKVGKLTPTFYKLIRLTQGNDIFVNLNH